MEIANKSGNSIGVNIFRNTEKMIYVADAVALKQKRQLLGSTQMLTHPCTYVDQTEYRCQKEGWGG